MREHGLELYSLCCRRAFGLIPSQANEGLVCLESSPELNSSRVADHRLRDCYPGPSVNGPIFAVTVVKLSCRTL